MDSFTQALIDQLKDYQNAGMSELGLVSESEIDQLASQLEQLEIPAELMSKLSGASEHGSDSGNLNAPVNSPGPSRVPSSAPSGSQEVATGQSAQPGLPGIGGDRLPYPPAIATNEKGAALTVIRDEVAGCTVCEELACKRKQTVFGVGDAAARICFLGEAPGADEDRAGEPFVGKAGQLLTRIIEACQLKREDVYILNTIKCRPPGNRNPDEEEIGNCWQYAHRQLEIIQPEVIVCLGSIAAKTLLNTKQSVGRLRQQFHRYRNSDVAVTYHPAYLLRNPAAKRSVWDDMKMVMKHLGVEL